MRQFQPLEKGIETKCNIVIVSPEAKTHAETKTSAEIIIDNMKIRNENGMMLTLTKRSITAGKKQVKGYINALLDLAIAGNHMLESLKPTSEVDPKNLKMKTRLEKMNDTKFLEECEVIKANLQKNKQLLLDYGYSEEQVNQLAGTLAKLNSVNNELSANINAYAEIRAQRNSIEKTIMERFDKMNKSIEVNKVLMPNLHRDYFAVKLVTAKKPQQGIGGLVTFDGQPLANAAIKLYATVESTPRKNASAKTLMAGIVKKEKLIYDKLTNADGEISIRSLKPDTYRLVIAKNGYKEQVVKVYINPKEQTMLNIKMEKL